LGEKGGAIVREKPRAVDPERIRRKRKETGWNARSLANYFLVSRASVLRAIKGEQTPDVSRNWYFPEAKLYYTPAVKQALNAENNPGWSPPPVPKHDTVISLRMDLYPSRAAAKARIRQLAPTRGLQLVGTRVHCSGRHWYMFADRVDHYRNRHEFLSGEEP
jgi:transcriptional regulator with XRE-family HTH domain